MVNVIPYSSCRYLVSPSYASTLFRLRGIIPIIELAEAYYRAAGRTVLHMEEDGLRQDVYIRTRCLVLLARRVDSSAPVAQILNLHFRFPRRRCDAWHLHFLSGDASLLLQHEREILSLPWILTQHGKRGDGRLVKLSSSRFCRLLKACGNAVCH